MNIIIEEIDPHSLELRGFTPSPSYLVQFTSQAVTGRARLVPASGLPDARPGDQFLVEVAQESISGFRECAKPRSQRMIPLAHAGDYEVQGVVEIVSHPSGPAGNRVTYVEACGVLFTLELSDMGLFRPEVGTCVEFVVHDMSLWDEAS
ncbi:hypothetical protein KY495_13265 [Massilia sp. PAMC28688]|uniref:hypothetical protein n=1 Tax=Massilia sp. PAMC28688 TaxID=2861283 RepID=UPI001C63619E|nr:hypothetical protein [Massilia sp. PAMC28688]QYF91767.1 hypothetical protein KY495_13265 [Massilia sp. PAMC28688]